MINIETAWLKKEQVLVVVKKTAQQQVTQQQPFVFFEVKHKAVKTAI
jgi:hypothetical protein